MAHRNRVEEYLNHLLEVERFPDYAPNGLQVEGREEIRRLATGVTASLRLLEAAAASGADAVLVHHGYFWKGEDPRVVGMKAARLRLLLQSDINLFAYHLPLDAHPELGNNAGFGRMLDLTVERTMDAGGVPGLLWLGRCPPRSVNDLAGQLASALGRTPTYVDGGPPAVERVAWCTGGGQRFIEQAADAGAQAFISGEISEPTAHVARERGLHYFAAGHHATERAGVKALGAHLAERFDLEHFYIEVDNPA